MVLMGKVYETAKAEGTYVDQPEGHDDRRYALFNEIAGGEEGFTFQDWLACSGKLMAIFNEIKAAEEAQ